MVNARLTREQADQIRADLEAGETALSIAPRYGVKANTISDIRRGLTWKEIDEDRAEQSDTMDS